MLELKNPYISVGYESGKSYGGSQSLSGNNTLSHYGCGVIAVCDLLLYIDKHHFNFLPVELLPFYEAGVFSKIKYNTFLRKMRSSYFPVIPGFGMNGLGLMLGVQLYFSRRKMPYSALWCVRDEGIWDKVEEMLYNDIPVIMAVGPNFPFVWRKEKALLYTKNDKGEYIPSSSVKAHFITITGMDKDWLKISSWGRCLYLNRRMYEEYVSRYSAPLVSNILYVRKKNKK